MPNVYKPPGKGGFSVHGAPSTPRPACALNLSTFGHPCTLAEGACALGFLALRKGLGFMRNHANSTSAREAWRRRSPPMVAAENVGGARKKVTLVTGAEE